MPIIYNSRYTAQKNLHYGDRIVKVCGGYIVMGSREYQICRKGIKGVKMSVSKEKFVRDMLMAQEARKCAEKEADALAIINLENVYESYMHNKKYLHNKKCTKYQYQC